MLNRMRELTIQAANGTNDTTDVAKIQDEIDELASAILLCHIKSSLFFNL